MSISMLLMVASLSGAAPRDTTGHTASGIWFRAEGAGPAVLLVHGSNLDSRSFVVLRPALLRDHRVIEVDLRYHGRSRDGTGPFSFEGDLLEVLDAIGERDVVVIGHSLGATVAVDLALAAPDRVRGLVLLGAAISGRPPTRPPAGFTEVIRAVRANDLVAAGRAMADTPVMTLYRDTLHRPLVRTMLMDNARLFSADRSRLKPLGSPAASRLGEVRMPVLVITGLLDPTEASDVAEALVRGLAEGRRRDLAGCGHMLPFDCAEEVVAATREFMERLTRR